MLLKDHGLSLFLSGSNPPRFVVDQPLTGSLEVILFYSQWQSYKVIIRFD